MAAWGPGFRVASASDGVVKRRVQREFAMRAPNGETSFGDSLDDPVCRPELGEHPHLTRRSIDVTDSFRSDHRSDAPSGPKRNITCGIILHRLELVEHGPSSTDIASVDATLTDLAAEWPIFSRYSRGSGPSPSRAAVPWTKSGRIWPTQARILAGFGPSSTHIGRCWPPDFG